MLKHLLDFVYAQYVFLLEPIYMFLEGRVRKIQNIRRTLIHIRAIQRRKRQKGQKRQKMRKDGRWQMCVHCKNNSNSKFFCVQSKTKDLNFELCCLNLEIYDNSSINQVRLVVIFRRSLTKNNTFTYSFFKCIKKIDPYAFGVHTHVSTENRERTPYFQVKIFINTKVSIKLQGIKRTRTSL